MAHSSRILTICFKLCKDEAVCVTSSKASEKYWSKVVVFIIGNKVDNNKTQDHDSQYVLNKYVININKRQC